MSSGPDLPIERMGAGELLVAIYAFYVFLYLDFSGYCDIVIGVGSLMGVKPPENFRFPFLARDVSEYWLRVHRSLTTWLTDYIFNPLYRFALGVRGGTCQRLSRARRQPAASRCSSPASGTARR